MDTAAPDTQNVRHILISGATGGIGSALVRHILVREPSAMIWAMSRRSEAMDQLRESLGQSAHRVRPLILNPLQEADLTRMVSSIQDGAGRLDMAIHTVGALSGPSLKAEKSLRDVNLEGLVESFSVNTASFMLLAKHLHRLFRHDSPSVFAAISAKVGSIADNQLGGWYSYRMSKAALNMAVRNVSLEYGRTGCKTTVLAVHPGTTETQLSKPFLAGYPKDQIAATDLTAERLYATLCRISSSETGQFINWDGSPLPW